MGVICKKDKHPDVRHLYMERFIWQDLLKAREKKLPFFSREIWGFMILRFIDSNVFILGLRVPFFSHHGTG